MDNRLNLALRFAAQGWKLFPQARNKKACIKGWPNQASSEPEQIRKWAKQFPKANWAVVTGKRSGVLVLDVDVKPDQHGESSFRLLQQEHEKLHTFTVRTGSGGGHLYFQYPAGNGRLKSRELADYPGVEVKADGGCATLPGSLYADGREYTITRDCELADCPTWLVELVKAPQERPAVIPFPGAPVKEGNRNRYLLRLAGAMRQKGAEEAAILAALLAENEQRCDPPLPHDEVEGIARSIAQYEPGAPKEKKKQPKQADTAIELSAAAELFHDGDIAYARFPAGNHHEIAKIRGKEFKTWLRRLFYEATQTAIGSQALEDALGVLEGQALFEGPEIATFVRIAGDDSTIYVDLGNEAWQVVVIDTEGWRIVDEAPVRFRRPPGLEPLPSPQHGGQLYIHLAAFLNMSADDLKLYTACLVNAFRPTGPYPVLCLHGEQGSAKSTAARIFRACIDPNTAMLRSTPREERDLMIAGTNGWVVAFDNLSHLPTWVSDALCRIATGSGFGVRQLYADDAEILFQVQRPVILNGIGDLAVRGDLLDRSVLVNLPAIPEEHRLTERSFLAQFEEARPLILGALLDAVSAAIRNLHNVKLPSVPRMADFCEWICAAEPALGWPTGTFLDIYRRNRADANSLALEATPIVPALMKLLDNFGGSWQGTATELHEALGRLVSDKMQKSRTWPKSGRGTSASLKRISPNLRVIGVDVEWNRTESERTIRLNLKTCVRGVFASLSSSDTAKIADANDANDANDGKTQEFDLSLNAYDDAPGRI